MPLRRPGKSMKGFLHEIPTTRFGALRILAECVTKRGRMCEDSFRSHRCGRGTDDLWRIINQQHHDHRTTPSRTRFRIAATAYGRGELPSVDARREPALSVRPVPHPQWPAGL